MLNTDDIPKHKKLVSVERQYETDISTGETEVRLFVKMYFEARDSGLLATLPDPLWKTLCCLSTYMNENGDCHPTQARVAKDLGISRQKLNRRIQRLLSFRFQGKPILVVSKQRRKTPAGGRWANNVYKLLPISGFGIFDGPEAPNPPVSHLEASEEPMSPQGDIGPMSPNRDTRKGDTNKNQCINQTHTRVFASREETEALVSCFHHLCHHDTPLKPTLKETVQAKELLAKHGPETAEYIVEFAVQKASESFGRPPEVFGAVLRYVEPALEAVEAKRKRQEQELEKKRRDEEYTARVAAEKARWLQMSPEERVQHRLEARVEALRDLKGREPSPAEVEEQRRKLIEEYVCRDSARV